MANTGIDKDVLRGQLSLKEVAALAKAAKLKDAVSR